MPAFTAIGTYVAGTLLGLAGTAATIVGTIVATGAAYVTSRVINGNPNKGNNSASNQGGRIQVPPATNNKIPVVYGSAYVNGIITDARLKSLGGTTNDTMYYCIVLSEYTNNLTTPNFSLENIIWNDLRLTAVDTTTNAHKVKDGRKVVDGAIVTAGSFVVGKTYVITKRGTTNFTLIGAQTNNIGEIFTATGVGTGTGQAQEEDFIDTNFVVDNKSLVELRVYAGGSSASDQIYPPQSTGNTANAYTFWADNDGTWTSANEMKGLVFAIVKLTYAGDKGFTGLPNVTWQLANNIANPADVWYDYMTSRRYGAGINPADIDNTAKTAWYNFCEEDISYTDVAGDVNQTTLRYQVNGVIDTANPVKTNIDTILQNGGAWMSYNVATGLWSPVIKKAVSAGTATDVASQFTAVRTGSTLLLASPFPSGRIEAGQRLYNSLGTFIGTITAQIFPLNPGETTGQLGRYTTSTSGTISLTTFYTLPATTLEFSDDNIISGISISSTRLDDLYNKVEAEFYNRYNKDQRAYYRTDLPSIQRNPNEPDNQLRLSLDLVNNSMQADILGQMEMRQSRDDLVIEFTSNHYGIQAQAGDVIAVSSELYDWQPKYFRVMRVKEIEGEQGDLTAQIQALEYNPDVYTIEPITEFSTSANIGIGNLISSQGLPAPERPTITDNNPVATVPNFTFNIDIPATGGPFDEAEIYFAEGWDANSVTGWIDNNSTPGTYSGVAGNIMTVTAVTYNSINPGDYFDLGGVTVVNQLTQTAIPTKTFVGLGLIGTTTFTLNNVTGVVIGQKPTGTGIPAGAMVIDVTGTTVTLDRAFTVQASGSYNFTTAGGTGTYTVNTSVATTGTDDLFDQPVDSDFSYLKKIVPDGNTSAFTSGSTISSVITELPANSELFRRYFLKARLGVKKNFGSFSPNTPVDIDGNNVNWQPNPSSSGGPGVFGDIEIAVETPTTISVVGDNKFITISQTSTSTSVPQNGLRISVESTGTPTAGFGTNLEFEIETAPGVKKQAGLIETRITDVTTGSEDAVLEFTVMNAGVDVGFQAPQFELDGLGNLTITGDLTVTGNDIKSSTDTALTLSGNNVQVVGDLTVNGNDIKSSSATAMTLSGNNVQVLGDLTVTGNDIRSSSATAITLNGSDVQVVGDLIVQGNDIRSSSATAITLNGSDVTVPGNITTAGGQFLTTAADSYIDYSGSSTSPRMYIFDGSPGTGNRKYLYLGRGGSSSSYVDINIGNSNSTGSRIYLNYPVRLSSDSSLGLTGANTNTIIFGAGSTPANQSYTLPQAYPASNGQVLSSTTGGVMSWATVSGSGSSLPAVKSESLSSQPWSTMPGCLYIGSIANALTIAAQTVRYHPFYVSAPITLTEVALSVSTATSLSGCNAMIYIVDVNLASTGWQPTSNRSGGYLGEITNITTTGIKSITGLTTVLPAGSYLIAVQFSNYTGTLQCRSLANQVITGNGYTAATSDGTTYAMARTGVTYTSGTPATAANWTNGAYGLAGHPGIVLAKWTVN